jgi:ribonuclease P/MRP protein subunit RPP40
MLYIMTLPKRLILSSMHRRLVAKLKSYGVNDIILKWIDSFLISRSQDVRIGFSLSSICPVINGVPQGSLLGPVLFIVYTNDITHLSPSNSVYMKLFSDNTKLYTVLHDDSAFSSDLQLFLDVILKWSEMWQLKLAATKCTVMRIIPKASQSFTCAPFYPIGYASVPVIINCTDLGVSYDTSLSFTPPPPH